MLRVLYSWQEPPDVVVIVWDTVRADRVTEETAPELHARPGRVYERAISPAIWTLPGHGSLFTGLPVRSHGAHGRGVLADVPTLAERFAEEGYATFLYSSNPYVSAETGLARGFQQVETSWDPTHRERALLRGRAVAPTFLAWREQQDGPVFAVLNYMEAHVPRVPSVEARERFTDPYDAAIWDLDRLTAELVADLDGLVVVTSDHGELLGEHGISGHHGGLWEPLLHVPLVLSGEGISGRVSEPVSTADLGRLLFVELGWDAPPPRPVVSERLGREFLRQEEEPDQLSVRSGDRKWIEGEGVFDLSLDPGELSPLELDPSLDELRDRFEEDWPVRGPAGEAELDPRLLEVLGYASE